MVVTLPDSSQVIPIQPQGELLELVQVASATRLLALVMAPLKDRSAVTSELEAGEGADAGEGGGVAAGLGAGTGGGLAVGAGAGEGVDGEGLGGGGAIAGDGVGEVSGDGGGGEASAEGLLSGEDAGLGDGDASPSPTALLLTVAGLGEAALAAAVVPTGEGDSVAPDGTGTLISRTAPRRRPSILLRSTRSAPPAHATFPC